MPSVKKQDAVPKNEPGPYKLWSVATLSKCLGLMRYLASIYLELLFKLEYYFYEHPVTLLQT